MTKESYNFGVDTKARLYTETSGMTTKRFENRLNKENIKFNTQNPVWDNKREDALNVFEMIDLLNELSEENEQLKEEKEKWKSNCSLAISENSILWNEINILREEGAEPSDAFKNYLNGLKSKNNKLQGDVE